MASISGVAERRRRSAWTTFWIRLVKEKPLGLAGGIATLFLLVVGVFADFIAPYGMNESWVGDFLTAPSAQFWMGTDNLGRDILSRVIYGARISVIVGLTASTIATILSVIIGVLSGFWGGKFDILVQRFIDAWMCMPQLIIILVLVTIMRPGLWSIIIVLGFTWGIPGSRIIRSAVLAIKENMYVQAAEAIGCSTARVLVRHILPNIMSTVIVLFSIRVPGIILSEASLSFLGFGIPAPTPSWGSMLSGAGRSYMMMMPWLAIWPGLALAITVYAVNMFGDAVRDLLDPKLKGGVGRYVVRLPKAMREK